MIAEVLLIKDENRYLLEHKKCRLFVGGIFLLHVKHYACVK